MTLRSQDVGDGTSLLERDSTTSQLQKDRLS